MVVHCCLLHHVIGPTPITVNDNSNTFELICRLLRHNIEQTPIVVVNDKYNAFELYQTLKKKKHSHTVCVYEMTEGGLFFQ